MLRDVFYYGEKPNVHPRERFAINLDDARNKATTEHFWIINEFCDYRNFDWDFDFEFLADEDVWAEEHINVWPSQHQKDSGTWLVNRENLQSLIVYRNDVGIVKRKNIKSNNWKILHKIDELKFDFSWHPDPTAPAYIYVWGNQYHPGTKMPTVEYHIEGALEKKYMIDAIGTLIADQSKFTVYENFTSFDYSWTPDPAAPPYRYAWGNQWNKPEDKISVEYVVDGATEYKYMGNRVTKLPCLRNWEVPNNIDTTGFDFSWEPSPADPPYIYEFGTQWQKTGGPKYIVDGATEIKYIDFQIAKSLPTTKNWIVPKNLDITGFDFSWHPDGTSPPYIYHFATQWALTGGPIYNVEGATETKYLEHPSAIALPDITNWEFDNKKFDIDNFDFSWHPYVEDQPYIYVFGTQHQKNGGPKYITPGVIPTSPIKYIDTRIIKAKRLPNKKKFSILNNYKIKEFDWSWHPDELEEPYIYIFGNNQYPAEIMPTIEYVVSGAKQVKYINEVVAVLDVDMTNWEIPDNIDTTGFDFSWKPNPKDPPYIYQFGTQWQKTGGPRYIVPDANEVKFVSTQSVQALPNRNNWTIPKHVDISNFDFSWHPDDTSPPYIYHFATQWALTGGPIYTVSGATEKKYLEEPSAVALENKENWVIPEDVDISEFDFSWHPYLEDQPYVYQFGTQHQKTGGPKYVTPGVIPTSPIKYIDTRILKAKKLPNKKNFAILNNYKIKDFDWSWHPDATDEPYIYLFGNNHYPAEVMPTIEYAVPGATQIKYISNVIATLDVDMRNWKIPENLDISEFDFSWKPNPNEPAYIYQFGTQWQKTGGPRYIVGDATEVKYIDTQKAKRLTLMKNWQVPNNIDISGFDFSWHPDDTNPAYIYVFGTQWALSGGPKYVMPNATEKKYIDDILAKTIPKFENWIIPNDIDKESFDFSWHPYEEDEPYIYEFGTQWQKTGGPRYMSPGADETSFTKYIDTRILKAKKLPNKTNWIVPKDIDPESIDFSWHPDETEPSYIYEFATTLYDKGGPKYYSKGAKDNITPIKYVSDFKAKYKSNKLNWVLSKEVDSTKFDFSWQPHPDDPPYIYRWGNKFVSGKFKSTIDYVVSGATEIKYMEDNVEVLPEWDRWIIPKNIDTNGFDFSWRPDPLEPDYIWEFGTQWQKTGGPVYKVPGATETKYIDVQKCRKLPDKKYFKVLDGIEIIQFDYSWHPDSTEEPYIYVFGNNQYSAEEMPTVEYIMPGATQKKFVQSLVAKLAPDKKYWQIPDTVDVTNFDFSWKPNPNDPPYIYQFGTQWQKTGGPRYIVPNSTEIKYVDDIKSVRKISMLNWEIPKGIEVYKFDFSWHPDELAPPYIYQFGTLIDKNDGPKYITPNHNGEIVYLSRVERENGTEIFVNEYFIETTLEDLIKEHPDEIFWAKRKNIDYKNFNFNWRPEIVQTAYELNFVHVFGSPDSELTQTYFISSKMYNEGFKEFKFIEKDKKADNQYLAELFVQPDIFLVDRGNSEVNDRFQHLKSRFTNVQKTRFLNTWVDTINRCINRSTTELCWILNSELDYSSFDFKYYPNPWQMKMIHVFGTQWSHWGTTFLVNRETFSEDTKYIKIIEHLSNLNFVKDNNKKAKATHCLYDVILIDHENENTPYVLDKLKSKIGEKTITTINYKNDYLTTFKEIIKILPNKKDHYIWICSSICDYTYFDFTYICDPFAKEQLHTFPSDKQKYGDTFLVNVNKLIELIDNMNKLQDYEKINFNQHQRVKRYDPPVIISPFDTHVGSILQDFNFPYAIYVTEDNKDIEQVETEPLNLWDTESKNILITSTGGTQIIVPKEAKTYVETQLYDYPYIKTNSKLAKSKPLDIVFLSNGEEGAEDNYQHLQSLTKDLPNRLVRVDGVNGRVNAYHAALEASNTPWAFTVFAKLRVNRKFNWNWQPDRLQIPKHYIFHAKNPVNGLTYGHQAIIAYNKTLVLNNEGSGLDFTMDDPHETVEILSGTAFYNTDKFSTWRTAFREVIKLQSDNTDISKDRLNTWLTVAESDYAEYSILGAKDAVNYYKKVKGDFTKLKLSYEWQWLKNYFDEKYK